jgi:hypothetical protein
LANSNSGDDSGSSKEVPLDRAGVAGSAGSTTTSTGGFLERRDTVRKYRVDEDFESQLRAIYTKYNPSLLPMVPAFVKQFEGRENVLLLELHRKYGIVDSDRVLLQGRNPPAHEDNHSEVGNDGMSGRLGDGATTVRVRILFCYCYSFLPSFLVCDSLSLLSIYCSLLVLSDTT